MLQYCTSGCENNGGAGFGANPSGWDSPANIRTFTNVLIDGTTFVGNHTAGGASLGDIIILGVDGDVTIQNVDITSGNFSTSRGMWFDFHGDASLTMDNVSFGGTPASWGMLITNYHEIYLSRKQLDIFLESHEEATRHCL